MNKRWSIISIFVLLLLWGCGSSSITESDAKKIAFDSANVQEDDLTSLKVESSSLDGEDTFVLVFQTAEKNYQIIVSKQDGEVLRSSYQSLQSSSQSSSDSTTSEEPVEEASNELTIEDAKKIALDDAGVDATNASFTKTKTEREDGSIVYELEFQTSDTYYEYTISMSGTIIDVDQEMFDYRNAVGNEITKDEAIQMVLSKVDGSSKDNVHIEEDWDDGMHLFEGELYHNNTKYEFEIDASSGTLLKWSMEYHD